MARIKPSYAQPRSQSSALCVLELDSVIKSYQTCHDCTFPRVQCGDDVFLTLDRPIYAHT